MRKVALGIDIGGTNSVFALVTKEGEIVFSDKLTTSSFQEPRDLLQEIKHRLTKPLLSNECIGVGIGAPNGNIHTGCIEQAPNLKWKGIVTLTKMSEEIFNCNALLTNDANAAALGEMTFGAAIGMNDFLFITLGTGLGSGIVSNGKIVYGKHGMAGEVGHTILIPNGRLCGCGRKGCAETYCSATGLIQTYKEICGNSDGEISSESIYLRALAGEKAAVDAFDYTNELLSLVLANSVAYTDPEAIFLFGGLCKAGNYLFEPLRLKFEDKLQNIYKDKIQILPSGLEEGQAALLGAASLVWSGNS